VILEELPVLVAVLTAIKAFYASHTLAPTPKIIISDLSEEWEGREGRAPNLNHRVVMMLQFYPVIDRAKVGEVKLEGLDILLLLNKDILVQLVELTLPFRDMPIQLNEFRVVQRGLGGVC